MRVGIRLIGGPLDGTEVTSLDVPQVFAGYLGPITLAHHRQEHTYSIITWTGTTAEAHYHHQQPPPRHQEPHPMRDISRLTDPPASTGETSFGALVGAVYGGIISTWLIVLLWSLSALGELLGRLLETLRPFAGPAIVTAVITGAVVGAAAVIRRPQRVRDRGIR